MLSLKTTPSNRFFQTPKVIKVMQELPKGPSGKIQRLKLPELVQESEEKRGKADA